MKIEADQAKEYAGVQAQIAARISAFPGSFTDYSTRPNVSLSRRRAGVAIDLINVPPLLRSLGINYVSFAHAFSQESRAFPDISIGTNSRLLVNTGEGSLYATLWGSPKLTTDKVYMFDKQGQAIKIESGKGSGQTDVNLGGRNTERFDGTLSGLHEQFHYHQADFMPLDPGLIETTQTLLLSALEALEGKPQPRAVLVVPRLNWMEKLQGLIADAPEGALISVPNEDIQQFALKVTARHFPEKHLDFIIHI